MKVLYIHGYGSNANSTTGKTIKDLSTFEVHTITYNPEEPKKAIKSIKDYVQKNKIDVIIGSSLGGFMTTYCFGKHRIVINPCLKPSIELPKIGYTGPVDEYKELENNLKIDNTCYGCFAKGDELLGTKYKKEFEKYFINTCFIPGKHRASKEALELIINEIIPNFVGK